MRRILSIDGGGIRGIIPAMVLAKIEQKMGKPISHMFDLIAGTSTGGILALGLTKPDAKLNPQFKAVDLLALYEERGAAIFHKASWKKYLPVGNIFEEKYAVAGIESVLDEYFGDTHLKRALTNVIITSYEIERRFPFFFRSERASQDSHHDFPMKIVARATSAAPTYFEPARVETEGLAGYYALVDGGVYANNPSLCAIVEAQRLFGSEECLMLSIGTGALTRPLPYLKARKWGVAQWAKPVLDMTFDGVSSTTDFYFRQTLPRGEDRLRRYFRLQPVLDQSLQDLDNASPSNIRGLKLLAESFIRQSADDIDELCSLL